MNRVCIGLDNGFLPIRRQAIIWSNAGILLIGPIGTNFSQIVFKIQIFSFKKMHLKISSVKWWPFCPGGDELTHWKLVMPSYDFFITGSANGLSSVLSSTTASTKADLLSMGPSVTNFSGISFDKMYLKMSSAKCWPFVFQTMELILFLSSMYWPRIPSTNASFINYIINKLRNSFLINIQWKLNPYPFFTHFVYAISKSLNMHDIIWQTSAAIYKMPEATWY